MSADQDSFDAIYEPTKPCATDPNKLTRNKSVRESNKSQHGPDYAPSSKPFLHFCNFSTERPISFNMYPTVTLRPTILSANRRNFCRICVTCFCAQRRQTKKAISVINVRVNTEQAGFAVAGLTVVHVNGGARSAPDIRISNTGTK